MVQQILLAPHVSTYIIGTTFSMYIIVITYYGLYYIIGITECVCIVLNYIHQYILISTTSRIS